MVSTKRVILANGSRLLREMLHHIIDKEEHLKVVEEVPNHAGLPAAIQKFAPEWVIVSLSAREQTHSWINTCLEDYPSVRFLFVFPDQNYIKMKWQRSYQQDFSDLSLKEFIYILEKDLERT
jgi:hypothetical protein